jgi:hypothetical protein
MLVWFSIPLAGFQMPTEAHATERIRVTIYGPIRPFNFSLEGVSSFARQFSVNPQDLDR